MVVSATDWTGASINGVTLGEPVLLGDGINGWDHALIPDRTVIDAEGHIFIEVPRDTR